MTKERKKTMYPQSALPIAVKPQHLGGRPKRIGSIDTSSGQIMWFVGYCPSCACKVLVPREHLETLKINIARCRSSITYRLLQYLLRRYDH